MMNNDIGRNCEKLNDNELKQVAGGAADIIPRDVAIRQETGHATILRAEVLQAEDIRPKDRDIAMVFSERSSF